MSAAASPVVPVGVRERVLDELDKAWLHGQRRTSWRRDESADAIIAALRPTDTGWRDIAALEQLFDQISSLCMAFNDEIHNADDTLGQINQLTYAGIAALRPGTVRTGK